MDKARKYLPVGVFDSGVGGISVLKEMTRLLPQEDFLFLGDSAHAPYGTRSKEEIRELTLGHVENLVNDGVKAVVVACNTATSAAILEVRAAWPQMPVIGIEPALKPAVMICEHPRVIVMATPATVAGDKFHQLLDRFRGDADVVPLPCPGLMEFVENEQLDGPEVEEWIRELLTPALQQRTDAIVLGCTHYPFLRPAIRAVTGDGVQLLDGSLGTAKELKRRLEENALLSDRKRKGQVTFRMTIPEKENLARRLLQSI